MKKPTDKQKAQLALIQALATIERLPATLAEYERTGDHDHGSGPLPVGETWRCSGGDCLVARAREVISVLRLGREPEDALTAAVHHQVRLGGDLFDLDNLEDYYDALLRIRSGDASGAVLPAEVVDASEWPTGWWLMPDGDQVFSPNERPTVEVKP